MKFFMQLANLIAVHSYLLSRVILNHQRSSPSRFLSKFKRFYFIFILFVNQLYLTKLCLIVNFSQISWKIFGAEYISTLFISFIYFVTFLFTFLFNCGDCALSELYLYCCLRVARHDFHIRDVKKRQGIARIDRRMKARI